MFSGIMIGGGKIIRLLVVLTVLLACFAFWVWMLVDCIRNHLACALAFSIHRS